jgi:uncharacterized phiE125 gp8 family phage protein
MLDATPIEAAALADALVPTKAYLRIETDEEDAVLASLIATATRLCEQFCGQAMIVRAMTETLGVSRDWRRLSQTPVVAITQVEGLPADGAPFVLAVDAYAIDIDHNGDGWVRVTQPGAAGRVRVTYDAGIAADWAGLDDPIRQGIIRLVAHLHANRDAVDGGQPPAAVAALWRPSRRMRLA